MAYTLHVSVCRLLIVPGTTAIAREIVNSLFFSKGIELFGAGYTQPEVENSGYLDYCHLPPLGDKTFSELVAIIQELRIDLIVFAHDEWILKFAHIDRIESAMIMKSSASSINSSSYKMNTYKELSNSLRVPYIYSGPDFVNVYPVFLKPNRGQGSRGALVIRDKASLLSTLSDPMYSNENFVISELLTGEEFTVDCYTNKFGTLLFAGSRLRKTVESGVAIHTVTTQDPELMDWAKRINESLKLSGPWFFQVKKLDNGEYCLMEVATRIAGASGVQRGRGINFMDLWVNEYLGNEVKVLEQEIFPSRAIGQQSLVQFSLNIQSIFVDFDDCLLVRGKINSSLMEFLKSAESGGVSINLVTRHEGFLFEKLAELRINHIFSKVFHLTNNEPKSSVMIGLENILFIDDSFSERLEVVTNTNALVLEPSVFLDQVTFLLNKSLCN